MARGKLGCGMTIVKNLVVLLNLAFLIGGATMIGLGAYAYRTQKISEISSVPLALGIIILGSVVTLISCFGCFGAMRENKCFLGFYTLLLFIIIVSQIAIGVAAYVERNSINTKLDSSWRNSTDEVRNTIQNEFKCCGWTNYNDFPGTSCPGTPSQDPGCKVAVEDFVSERLKILGIVGLVIAGIEIFGFLFSICLIRHIHSPEEKREQLLRQARNDNVTYHGNRN